MKVDLTIKNYRCFVRPTTIAITKDLTAFVGTNNSGKSALMRFLYEFRDIFRMLEGGDQFREALQGNHGTNLHDVLDREEVFSNLTDAPISFKFDFTPEAGETVSPSAPRNIEFMLSRSVHISARATTIANDLIGGAPINPYNANVFTNQANGQALDRSILLPILRALGNTLYIGPFRNTVSVGANANYLDIQIGDAFISQFRELKSGNARSGNRAILQLTDDIRRIFEFESLSIDATADNKSLHIEVNGKPYKQHELGTGLAQFIVVLANASTKKPSYILIDEPELGLHPRLQLDFLTTLASYASEGVWFSTHILGLARSTTENIYSVHRKADGDSQVTRYDAIPRLAEFLGEMSFAAHKELGFERVLLVEGSTDVKSIQQILRKFNMDHRIVLLSLSGRIVGDMAEELEEILRITDKISAVIDSEKTSENAPLAAQRQAFVTQCDNLGIPCLVLQKRAIENYFPDRAVKQVFGQNYAALNEFEKLEEKQPHWPKNQNWKLANAMTDAEIRATDLGQFLEAL